MGAKYVVFAIVLIFGVVWAQTSLPVSLPPELEGKINQDQVEAVKNKSVAEIKARCEKNGGPDAFAKAENASKVLMECVTSLVNVSSLRKEIEDAKPNGRVDEVFKKYCEKKPQFESCAREFTNSSSACFSTEEQKHLKTVYNVSEQLAEFICFKEGDRIALFIAEGGQECFEEKQEGLKACFNKTLGAEPEVDINQLSNVTISFDEKQCNQIAELQICVIAELESCPKPTSANIVESLFKFIRKSTPCKNFGVRDVDEVSTASTNTDVADKSHKGSASSVAVTSVTIIMAAATKFVCKLIL